ncbi:metalloprotease 1 precursor [Beauveria bassiana ARSEF 2860]|uniref:Metalloprotease 1 n=1 Tax=Beauveria bassiana (strain ARSEF 2860) TaxID=655819 RepID=J4KQ49_BEAB2|nr:metalloprotease 1 precursor [Beauveria bassiana ARSEF 2860]EJP68584.1 metalloprotease 1 precursor [Beauveria bassiana ARSEF 2860]
MTKFLTLLLPLLARFAAASTAVSTPEDVTMWCDGELDVDSADLAPFYDPVPLHDALQGRQEAQQFPPLSFRVFNHVVYANETVKGGYVSEYDVKKVVDMLSTDFGRFGVSFTYVNTTYTLSETLTTVTNRKEMYKKLVRPRRLGGYADLNLFWVAFLNGAKGTCSMPAPGYLSGERARDQVVPADACTLRATTVEDVGGKVITHEVGHWLGLLHPWTKGCEVGDYVADTWPQEMGTNDIPQSKRREDNGGEVFQCGEWRPSNYRNFMDYFPYRTHFTDLQGERIRAHGYLRHKYSTERPVSISEGEVWAGCKVSWNGPKSFPNGLACEMNSTETLFLSCAAKAAAGGSAEPFTIEAPCPLRWVGPAEFDGEVNCEELNFNHFQCKPATAPQVPSQTEPAKEDEEKPWVWEIAEDIKSEPKQEQEDEEKPWVWDISDN